MHLKTFATLAVVSLFAGSVRAADAPVTSTAPVVVTPSSPAPVLVPAAPAPNQIVYTPRLPTAAELTNAAAAQNLTVERLEQSATQMVAVYKNASGQINTVAYQTLPPAGTATPTVPVYTAPTPAPAVVYEQPAPRVVYYYDDPVYYPRVWYPPVSLSLGFGYSRVYGHGFYRGGGGFHRWR